MALNQITEISALETFPFRPRPSPPRVLWYHRHWRITKNQNVHTHGICTVILCHSPIHLVLSMPAILNVSLILTLHCIAGIVFRFYTSWFMIERKCKKAVIVSMMSRWFRRIFSHLSPKSRYKRLSVHLRFFHEHHGIQNTEPVLKRKGLSFHSHFTFHECTVIIHFHNSLKSRIIVRV
jgi:hypothetical protein